MFWPSSSSLGLLILAASTFAAEEKPCTIHNDGKYYDLSALSKGKDYEFKSPGGHNVVLGVCKAVAHETWGLEAENPAEVAAFVRKDHGDFSMGKVNTTLGVTDSNLQLVYSGGSLCKSTDGLRSTTTINFICDTSVFTAGTPKLVMQHPPEDDLACGFFIEWRTHVACPAGEGGAWSFFSVLIMFAIILVMIYLVVGTLHNRYVLQLQGFDQVPQFSLTSMKYHFHHAVDWVKETLATGSFHMPPNQVLNPVSHQSTVPGMPNPQLQRPTPRRGHGGPETNPVSHQTQVGLGHSPVKPQSPPRQQGRKFDLESGGIQEERERMLHEAEDVAAQELADVPKPPANTSSTTTTAPANEGSGVAQIRGRGIDLDGVIRL